MNPLIDYFQYKSQRLLSDHEKEFLAEIFKEETYKKKTILFRNGDINTKHYFIAQGLTRLYVIDHQGREFNVLFARENQIIGDLSSPAPTRFFLETIEDSIVYSADNDHIEKFNAFLLQKMNFEGMDILRRSYIFLQRRLISILTNNAEENYLELLRDYPDLVQRLPQYQVASYLGVSPEFLSKIIAKTIKK